VRTLDLVKTELKDGGAGNMQEVRKSVEKQLNIESVDYPDIKDIKITREGKSWVINASYDDQAPLFQNIFILVTFDKTVRIGSESGE
jgi:hypothetical protein